MSKNVDAATMTKAQAAAAGILDSTSALGALNSSSRKLYGFTDKRLPAGLPTEPRFFIYSVSDYGEVVSLGPGFGRTWEVKSCPEGAAYGPACAIDPLYFFKEVKVDVTEYTPHSDVEIVGAILKTGGGMKADLNRARVGWFVSEYNPPKQEEVVRATEIYIRECQRLLNEGNQHATANELKEINETHRRAAKYLKQKVDWDKPQFKMQDCPRCGDPVKFDAIVHAVPHCGHVFKLIPYWKSMIESGQKTMEEAPLSVQEELTGPVKKAK